MSWLKPGGKLEQGAATLVLSRKKKQEASGEEKKEILMHLHS